MCNKWRWKAHRAEWSDEFLCLFRSETTKGGKQHDLKRYRGNLVQLTLRRIYEQLERGVMERDVVIFPPVCWTVTRCHRFVAWWRQLKSFRDEKIAHMGSRCSRWWDIVTEGVFGCSVAYRYLNNLFPCLEKNVYRLWIKEHNWFRLNINYSCSWWIIWGIYCMRIFYLFTK